MYINTVKCHVNQKFIQIVNSNSYCHRVCMLCYSLPCFWSLLTDIHLVYSVCWSSDLGLFFDPKFALIDLDMFAIVSLKLPHLHLSLYSDNGTGTLQIFSQHWSLKRDIYSLHEERSYKTMSIYIHKGPCSQMLDHSGLVTLWLECCKLLWAGLPLSAVRPLQLIQNAAVWLVFNHPQVLPQHTITIVL